MKRIIIPLFLGLLISCSDGGNKQQGPPYFIDLTRSLPESNNKLSDFVESIDYLKPDTSSGGLLSWIYGIKITDERVLLRGLNTINIYDWEGSFLTEINSIGRGPGEYSRILDFDINHGSDSVIILSGRTLHYYSVKDGSFIKELKLEEQAWSFKVLDDEHFYLGSPPIRGEPVPTHHILNRSGEQVKYSLNKFIFKSDLKVGINNEVSSYRTMNGIFYSEYLDDTVYSVSPVTGFSPYVIFDKGNLGLTIEKRNSPALEKVFQECMITSGFFESNTYLFVGLNYKNVTGLLSFNKETGDYSFNEDGVVNDLDGGLPLKYALLSNDSILISIAYPTDIVPHQIEDKYKTQNNNKFIKLKSLIGEEDNPVVVIFRILRE